MGAEHAEHGPPFRGIEWTDELERLAPSRALIQRGLTRVGVWIAERAADRQRRLSVETLLDFHRTCFGDVFPELSGRLRGPAPRHLPTNRSFGNRRALPYEEVPAATERLVRQIGVMTDQLDRLRAAAAAAEVEEQALRVASFAHCDLIRIHPFVNGNGRVARLCVNYLARRYGIRFVGYERVDGEYIAAIDAWLDRRDIATFVAFLRPRWRRHEDDRWRSSGSTPD